MIVIRLERILFVLAILKHVACFEGLIGPADFQFQLIEDCAKVNDIKGIDLFLSQKKFNRTTHVISVKIDTNYNLDDSIIMELVGCGKSNGRYQPGSFYSKKAICEALQKLFGDTFYELIKSVGGVDDCPLPAGVYEMDNFYVDSRKYNVPQLYGDYKMSVNIFQNGELLPCFNVLYELHPRDIKFL